MNRTSLREDITSNYFSTTAGRDSELTPQHYRISAEGLLRRLRPWLPARRDRMILDLACGCGEAVYLLESLGYQRITGVDACGAELQHARKFVKSPLFESGILEFVRSLPDQSVSCVLALNILEHLEKTYLRDLLIEIRRALAPGGTLIAMVPNAMSPFAGLTRHWDMTHEWAFSANNFRQLAVLAGFRRDVEFRECGPVPYGLVSSVRYVLWQSIRMMLTLRMLIEVATARERVFTMDMLVRMRVD